VTTEAGLAPEGMVGLQLDVVRLLSTGSATPPTSRPTPRSRRVRGRSDRHHRIPRTGTTKLQRLMAADPTTQSITCGACCPGAVAGEHQGRTRASRSHGIPGATRGCLPGLPGRAHDAGRRTEEEALIAQMTFDRLGAFDWFYDTPSYTPTSPIGRSSTLRLLRSIVQYCSGRTVAAASARDPQNPLHTANVSTLLATFPRRPWCTATETRSSR